jgi:hypothetical protein
LQVWQPAQVQKDPQDHLVPPVHLDLKDPKVHQVRKVLLDPLAQQGRQKLALVAWVLNMLAVRFVPGAIRTPMMSSCSPVTAINSIR